jgi:hypothetical protein
VNIYEICQFLNFYVQKERGTYFSFPELTDAIDRAQMALYSDLQATYGTSQRSQDALAPFLETYDFTTSNTLSGYIVIPDTDYLTLLDITISYVVGARTVYKAVQIVNKDERALRLNSQVNPVSATNPIAEMSAPRYIRIWPVTGLTGFATYFRRPVKPVLSYTLISGRVPYYDSAGSTQVEWPENFLDDLMIKTLETLGINMGDDKVVAFSAAKAESNFINMNNS